MLEISCLFKKQLTLGIGLFGNGWTQTARRRYNKRHSASTETPQGHGGYRKRNHERAQLSHSSYRRLAYGAVPFTNLIINSYQKQHILKWK